MKPVYIISASAISPQESFEGDKFLRPPLSSDTGKLYVVDADYKSYINPVAIRRMSKLLKMGISTAMNCLQKANISSPDAIITGTAKGSMLDMEHFLKDMIRLNEEALNPTYFIQSTYNSINGWIALQTKCTGYNQTFVHRGISLELSLLDAQLFLNEEEGRKHVLAGCFDEMTEEYFFIKNKIDYWRKEIPDSLQLIDKSDSEGTIGGEGAAFFTLSNEKDQAVCALTGIKTFNEPDVAEIGKGIQDLLSEHGLSAEDLDLMLCGMNGDSRQQWIYETALREIPETKVATFKQLTGEYPTSSGFALWLATNLFQAGNIPEEIIYRKGNSGQLKNILIMNHYVLGTVSLILLSAV
jgi:3-oxoacyl-[acyl-carrier-protein] synthase II